MRTLYQRRIAALPHVTEHLRLIVKHGHDIRVAEVVPLRLLIFDGLRAVVPLDATNGTAGAIAVEGEVFVRHLVSVFNHLWQYATRFEGLSEVNLRPLTAEEEAVLRMLACGLKDEKIARALRVSVRTVGRIVADLMQRVDATSRFQAGIRAAQLGWVE